MHLGCIQSKQKNVEGFKLPLLAIIAASMFSLITLPSTLFWISAFVLGSCSIGGYFVYWLAM
jgi:hypothetical protein